MPPHDRVNALRAAFLYALWAVNAGHASSV